MRSCFKAVSCLGVALISASVTLSGCAGGSRTVEGPDDFVAVVEGALATAEARLPHLGDCLTDFTVRPDWDLDDRATYLDGVISVRVPATAPRIEQVVIHELTHHLDSTCPAVDDVRPLFLAAQETDVPWAQGATWAETPAEQFAEAVTIVVLDRRRANNVVIRSEAIDVVAEWAGSPSSGQAD